MEKVFYVPGQPWVIDFAVERADGVTVSQLQGHTLNEVQARSPGVIITTYEDATARIEAGSKTEPRQIDVEDFDYALNVLPPVRWVRGGDVESFKMSERTNGRVTSIYSRVGASYWKFEDIYTMSHNEIIAKVRKVIEHHGDELNSPWVRGALSITKHLEIGVDVNTQDAATQVI
ncbi:MULTISPECIES: hypothetical protein [unclassified Pseudomonas]|uniref:hypothetical protein n=1 Tax=unclassified Pseudomonas TaxID=196821 RepID=UPI002B23C6A2|nr:MULTISPECIES: hypothetical protein [unclassified Pseudomonas]MEA9979902.1 hypothetical protein [Pseudomonas sp. RTS4]MEB0198185.1 hypothetical protein [Pseudomonas sp. 5S4]MEB0247826.1 hypothetical protein [Pseudomonas sp. 10S5]